MEFGADLEARADANWTALNFAAFYTNILNHDSFTFKPQPSNLALQGYLAHKKQPPPRTLR